MKPRIPRRILMTADPIGGVWTFALELARSFEPHGIQIGLATMGARLSRVQRRELAGRKNVRLFESNY
ncbi:MAG TPA: glycosyltransferase family 1 protein, partial [Candidatus Binatia bacterium]|nr:glycosyltransferase family 1 protein [Candidatus Binatia bacterium]